MMLLFFIILLIIVIVCLFNQNTTYKSANRKLILQNDSLTGVTIELNRKIDRSKADSLFSTISGDLKHKTKYRR
jgi:hypothetical protein